MTRRVLINDREEEEVRVAVLDGDRLSDLFIERAHSRKYLGNIYRGRVLNVEPAIEAAFVDFGGDRNGFLHASDVMPFYADGPQDLTAFERRPRGPHPHISELLAKGQDVLVQVSKDGIGSKGPTLTTYVSVPGRLMVLMPSLSRVGVSKKIREEQVRKRLKQEILSLELPGEMGLIVRTAGAGSSREDLARDVSYLLSLWESMVRRVRASKSPATIYRESDLVIRTMRDIVTEEVSEVVVDSGEVHDRAAEFLAEVMPHYRDRLRLFTGRQPLFHAFGVEEQIEKVFRRRVPLPSGGSLVIEQTEALVAIDVNSGRFRKEADLEETAWRLNLEAIPEICRQLRLRDLGGLIVVDLVDMRDPERRKEVERTFLRELRRDRARVRVAPISEFGALELTRQRVRPSLRQETYEPCSVCRGTGFVKSVESMVLKVLRDVRVGLRQEGGGLLTVQVHPDVAAALLNERRAVLVDLERQSGREIRICGDPALEQEEVRLGSGEAPAGEGPSTS